jgi:predicted RND superfamily exporter protein
MKSITIISAIVLFGLLAYSIYKLEFQYDKWDEKIKQHERISDSLKNVVRDMDIKVNKKDSILLTYMASLDKTLIELNKEALKNRDTVKTNLAKLDSLRLGYCREMEALGFKPTDCK